MNAAIKSEIDRLVEQQEEISKKIAWLIRHADKIPIVFSPSFSHGNFFDFDNLSHEEVISVLKSFGGKWSKELSSGSSDRIDYTTELDGIIVRCWQGDPPPNCKVVEVTEIVPAQAETTRIVRKLVCKETVDASKSV